MWPEFLDASARDSEMLQPFCGILTAKMLAAISSSCRYEQSSLQSLQDYYYDKNPWVPKKLLIPGGQLHRTESFYPEDELIKTEFYSDFLRPNNLFKGFGSSLFNDHRFAFLSIVRSKQAGPPSSRELKLLSSLTPHLQRAMQLHEQFLAPPLGANPATMILDRMSRGVIFLGHDRRVHYMNRAAIRICEDADGFSVNRDGLCCAIRPTIQAKLDALISGAINYKSRPPDGQGSLVAGGAVALSRPSLRRPYGILVAPAPVLPLGFGIAHAAAILFVFDPECEFVPPRDLLQQLFGLTRTEAQLAISLSSGAALETAADGLGITYQTARSYLKAVFTKTRTRRQAQLVALISRFGDTPI